MPKPRKQAPAAQPKPQIRTCMGMVDADDILVRHCGPLRRADGAAAYNGHFWPLDGDWFWANREVSPRYSGRWHFSVIALQDGTWLAETRAYKAVQYPTREAALRVSAARFLRLARAARRWDGPDRMTPEQYAALAAWVFGLVGRPAPRIRVEPPPPPPAPAPPAWSDLPLFAAPTAPIATTPNRGRP